MNLIKKLKDQTSFPSFPKYISEVPLFNQQEPGAEEELLSDAKGKLKEPTDPDYIDLVTIEDANHYDIAGLIAMSFSKWPFIGYITSNLKRKADWDIPTAAITNTNVLLYNPRFMMSLSTHEQYFVLLHEILHKIHRHFKRGDDVMFSMLNINLTDAIKSFDEFKRKIRSQMAIDPDKDFSKDDNIVNEMAQILEQHVRAKHMSNLFNITMDCSINQGLSKHLPIPKICITLAKIQEQCKRPLEADREWEYYFFEIIKDQEENAKNELGKGTPQAGEAHDTQIGGDGDGDGDEKEDWQSSEGHFKDLARKALQKQNAKDAGSDGNFRIKGLVPDMDAPIDDRHIWKKLINKCIGNNRVNEFEYSIKRPNRRLDEYPLGKVKIKQSKHCIAIIDTSGSCLDIVDEFLGVVQRAIKKHETVIDLLFTTTEVYSVYLNQRKLTCSSYDLQSGGTDLTLAQDWITENTKHTGHGLNVIVLTDGETPWKTDYTYNVSVIYTKNHSKLPDNKITNWAVFDR